MVYVLIALAVVAAAAYVYRKNNNQAPNAGSPGSAPQKRDQQN